MNGHCTSHSNLSGPYLVPASPAKRGCGLVRPDGPIGYFWRRLKYAFVEEGGDSAVLKCWQLIQILANCCAIQKKYVWRPDVAVAVLKAWI